MEIDLVDNILDRLTELPADVQDRSLRNASVIMENWKEISDSLTNRAIEREFYEVCAILRDI
jgi:hypothetical protein